MGTIHFSSIKFRVILINSIISELQFLIISLLIPSKPAAFLFFSFAMVSRSSLVPILSFNVELLLSSFVEQFY